MWDVNTGTAPLQEFPLDDFHASNLEYLQEARHLVHRGLEWKGNKHVLLGYGLFDLDKQCLIWKYPDNNRRSVLGSPNAQTWYVARR